MAPQSDLQSLIGQTHHSDSRRFSYTGRNFHLDHQTSFYAPYQFVSTLTSYFKRRKMYRCFAIGISCLLILTAFTVMYPGLKGPPHLRSSNNNITVKSLLDHIHKHQTQILEASQFVSYDAIQQENFSFNINSSDVMVFLHIQKTGGTTFGKHLVQDIDLEAPCICHRKESKKHKKPAKKMLRCECLRPNSLNSNWLFSRYSMGWKCGLHADWTELTECVDDFLNTKEGTRARRYFYVSMLRDPIHRYISEYRHVQRGATWKGSTHVCHGQPVSKADVPPCYDENTETWENVSLQAFMDCPTNWAVNRQTRMLADLRLVHCYNMTAMSRADRDTAMLQSAKNNLEQLAFFGLTELQNVTQYIFEETFNLKFRVKFEQQVSTSQTDKGLSQEDLARTARINHLDVELYDFAKKLLLTRFETAKRNDNFFEEHFEHANSKVFNFKDIEEDEDDYN